MKQSANWILRHKYEIDNHFTPLDWIKIYSEAIKDQRMDMNMALYIVGHEEKLDDLVNRKKT